MEDEGSGIGRRNNETHWVCNDQWLPSEFARKPSGVRNINAIDDPNNIQQTINESSLDVAAGANVNLELISNNEELLEKKMLQNNEQSAGKTEKTHKKRTRKQENKRKVNKQERMEGKEYFGFRKVNGKFVQDVPRGRRELKPRPCTTYCTVSKIMCCDKFAERDREIIFNNFWQNMNWTQKQDYVNTLVIAVAKKEETTSRKSNTLLYHLNKSDTILRVCKQMFINTLGIKEWAVRWWVLNHAPKEKSEKSVKSKKLRKSRKSVDKDEK